MSEEKNSHYSALQKQPGHRSTERCYSCMNAIANNPLYIYNIGLNYSKRVINLGIHALSLTKATE